MDVIDELETGECIQSIEALIPQSRGLLQRAVEIPRLVRTTYYRDKSRLAMQLVKRFLALKRARDQRNLDSVKHEVRVRLWGQQGGQPDEDVRTKSPPRFCTVYTDIGFV